MTFIETVPESEATGATAEIYETDRQAFGHVPNFTQAFSQRPDAYAAWQRLNATIKGNVDPRRYELATVAAACRLRSSYCALAHGTKLAELMDPDSVRALVSKGTTDDLDPAEVAIVELADKVAADATSMTEADIERARSVGLSDQDILDVVLAAAVRCFFSKTLDALGVEPDAKYAGVDPPLRDALTVGRAIAEL
jgi:uncharacterized peroxidase-related enzyme